jgi:hypothetical protein
MPGIEELGAQCPDALNVTIAPAKHLAVNPRVAQSRCQVARLPLHDSMQ